MKQEKNIDNRLRHVFESEHEPDETLLRKLISEIPFQNNYPVSIYGLAIAGILIIVLFVCTIQQVPTDQDFTPTQIVSAERITISEFTPTQVVQLTNKDRISSEGASDE